MTSIFKKFALSLVAVTTLNIGAAASTYAADQAVAAAFAGQKATARNIMLQRGVWGHYTAMNNVRDGGLTYPEMDKYFTAMHYAFDANNDGLVHRHEAPKIMLRYTLSGKSFPHEGLSLPVLRGQLQTLFARVDRNRDRKLSKLELLR